METKKPGRPRKALEDADQVMQNKAVIADQDKSKRATRKKLDKKEWAEINSFNGKIVKKIQVAGGTTYSRYLGNVNKPEGKELVADLKAKGMLKLG